MNTITIVASGPSLSFSQVELVRQAIASDRTECMAVNDNYVRVPECGHVFALDMKWWYRNYDNIPLTAQLWTLDTVEQNFKNFKKMKATRLNGIPFTREFGVYDDKVHHGGNSGYVAIQLARILGYDKIVLVGFDHQHADGKRHWFGDHDMSYYRKNADDVDIWQDKIENLALELDDVDVVNCTINTAIQGFRRSTLEQEI
jgi:hypothetical protein